MLARAVRILLLHQDPAIHPRSANGAGRRIRSLLKAWSDAGHSVEFVSRSLGAEDRTAHVLPRVAVRAVRASARRLAQRAGPVQEQLADRIFERSLSRIADRFEPDVVVERASLFGGAAARVARRSATPHVLDLIAPMEQERLLRGRLAAGKGWRRFERRVLLSAGAVQTPSSAVSAHARSLGVPNERLQTVRGGVDAQEFDPARFERIAHEGFVLGLYAAPGPWQGSEAVAALMHRLHEHGAPVRLEVLGAGATAQALKTMLAQHGLQSSASFRGQVPPDRVPRILSGWDACVVPGVPDRLRPPSLALYEAMAMALPVLAADTEDTRVALGSDTDDAAGFVIRAQHAQDAVDAVLRLVGDRQLWRRMGEAGVRRATPHHAWSRVAESLLEHARPP
jgi:glycosyltransferase involved in cell wall biosynthesis